jgi:CheY-like chemotaxis protein
MKGETKRGTRSLTIGQSREVALAFAVRITKKTPNYNGGIMTTTFFPTKAALPAHWMVVDDNRELLAMMQMALEQIHDDSVECFHSPQAALAAFAAEPKKYALVITDFEMPGMDGIELCRRLHEVAGDLKVFLATGSGFFTEAAAAYAGFSGLLSKPFHLEKLRAMLSAAGVPAGGPVAA